MSAFNKEFYEKLSGKKLSDQEVFEARNNFIGFFDLLYRIDKRLQEKKGAYGSQAKSNKVKEF